LHPKLDFRGDSRIGWFVAENACENVARGPDLVGERYAIKVVRDILKPLAKRALVVITFYYER
jgi:hypothetical protein